MKKITVVIAIVLFVGVVSYFFLIPDAYKKRMHQYRIATGTVPDIKFYGRVIDQYNQPVVGASIYFEGTNQFLLTGGGRGQIYTDSDGYFVINGGGVELVLGVVTLDGIEYAYPRDGGNNSRNEFRDRDLSKHFANYDDPTGRYPNLHDYESRENPYVIQAWRLGEYEGALPGGTSSGLESGKTYTYNLTDPDRTKRKKEGVHNGDLHITCTRHHIMKTTTDYGDWSFSIAPVNGGIQETDDLFMFMAPDSGYKASVNIDMNKSSENYEPQLLNKSYYFTSNNGKTHGSLFVHISAYGYNTCKLNISARVNRTGSRNLELKEKK